jgi:hypothetical protein
VIIAANDGVDGPRRHHQCQTGGDDSQPARGPPMAKISMIGLDLAKNVFQIHGIDAAGKVVLRRQLRRGQMEKFFAQCSRRSWDASVRRCASLGPRVSKTWARSSNATWQNHTLPCSVSDRSYYLPCSATRPRCTKTNGRIASQRCVMDFSRPTVDFRWDIIRLNFEPN